MAKAGKRKVNKSDEIRKAYNTLGDSAKPKDVQAHLRSKRIKASTGLISNVRYSMLHKNGGSGRRGRPAKGDQVSVTALLEAKRLVDKTGSVEEAKRALDTLAKISV